MPRPSPESAPECESREFSRRVVDHGEARHVFAAATSNPSRPRRRQIFEAVSEIGALIAAGPSTVRITAFLDGPDSYRDFQDAMESAGAIRPQTSLAIDAVWQPPADGAAVAIEAWSAGEASDLDWIHGSSGSSFIETTHDRAPLHPLALDRFHELESVLRRRGVGMARVVRVWLYLGGIVDFDPSDEERYRALNRARSDVFRSIRFAVEDGCKAPAHPASTGIGCGGRGLLCGAVAVVPRREGVRIVAMENPRQTPTGRYEDRYGPSRPMFSRGVAVVAGDDAMIFVSGTASILGSETRHVGDAEAQTEEATANIEALVAESNAARHSLAGFGGGLDDIASARVYVKREGDFEAVRDVCRGRLGSAPIVFTIADVCRPDLLVEIEAVVHTSRVGSGGEGGG